MSGINPTTGEVDAAPADPLERERMRVCVLEDDLRLLQEEHVKTLREVSNLRGQLNRQATPEPKMFKAHGIANYYRLRLGKGKAWKFGDKRQKAVLARLREDFDPLYICRAIDGLAVSHHVNSDTGVHYDDLELVCRDETNLERFYETAVKNDVPTLIDGGLAEALGSDLLPSDVQRRVSDTTGEGDLSGHVEEDPPEFDYDAGPPEQDPN